MFNLPTAIISRIITVRDRAKRNRNGLKSQRQKPPWRGIGSPCCGETATSYQSRTRPLSAGQRINGQLCPVCYSVVHAGRQPADSSPAQFQFMTGERGKGDVLFGGPKCHVAFRQTFSTSRYFPKRYCVFISVFCSPEMIGDFTQSFSYFRERNPIFIIRYCVFISTPCYSEMVVGEFLN